MFSFSVPSLIPVMTQSFFFASCEGKPAWLRVGSSDRLRFACCAVLSHSVVSTLCNPMVCSLPGSSIHGDSPGKNTEVGCHALFQGIFPTQGSNLHPLSLLHWQACSLLLAPNMESGPHLILRVFKCLGWSVLLCLTSSENHQKIRWQL